MNEAADYAPLTLPCCTAASDSNQSSHPVSVCACAHLCVCVRMVVGTCNVTVPMLWGPTGLIPSLSPTSSRPDTCRLATPFHLACPYTESLNELTLAAELPLNCNRGLPLNCTRGL